MSLNKFLLLLIILIGSSFAGRSQTIDTLCPPVKQLKKVYADALKYRYTDSLLKLTEHQLAEKKEQVRLLEDKEFEVTGNHRREITNLEGQVATLKEQVAGFEKMYKRERFKRRLSQGLGVLATAAAMTLFIIKK